MGLTLKSPVIVGSSGLSENTAMAVALEQAGAGAIVLKSLFEEQIMHDVDAQRVNNMYGSFSDQENYALYFSRKHNLTQYINMIKELRTKLSIPVIASINCASGDEWVSFAKTIENAGADALEVNLFLLPGDINQTGDEKEAIYFDIIAKIKAVITIPFSLKISYYFSGLANFIHKLSFTGARSVVLFNKFWSPDVDIETEKVVPGDVFSIKELNTMSLRWIGILYNKVNLELAASRGIFDGETVIKNLLVGAQVTQIVSAIYKNGPQAITQMNETLASWMERHHYDSIEQFRGKAAQTNIRQQAMYERTQFMKYFSDAGY